MRFQPGLLAAPRQFPVIEATRSGTSGWSMVTSYDATLPPGVVEGDLLLLASTKLPSSPPAGWSSLIAQSKLAVLVRVANGAEGGSVTLTGTQGYWDHIAYRISGVNPEHLAAAYEPSRFLPALSAPWGESKNCWVAIGAGDYIEATPPEGYTTDQHVSVFSGRMTSAHRMLEAASVSGKSGGGGPSSGAGFLPDNATMRAGLVVIGPR